MYRTHHCHQLRKTDEGLSVTLAGWVNTVRDQGGVIFVDLRDREGVTQIVFRTEESGSATAASHKLRHEDVVQITGKVAARLAGTENAKLVTGEIEVIASDLKLLNKSDVPPFPLDDPKVNEDLRLEYRYLDLRTAHMQRNLKLRHRVAKTTRDTSTSAATSKSRRPSFPIPHPREPAISSFRRGSIPARSTPFLRRRSST